MKRIIKHRIRMVVKDNPEQFQDEVNKLYDDLDHLKPKVEFDISSDDYKALFQFDEVKEIPETASDELQVRGLDLRCGDCPYFEHEKNNDGSIRRTSKHGTCHIEYRPSVDSPVCDFFAREYLKGGAK